MMELLTIKEYIRNFIAKYDIYLIPVAKFAVCLTMLFVINGRLGYMSALDSIIIVLVVSLLASLLPWNFMLLAGAAFILLHLYALSLVCALVALVLFLLFFLLYFRFAPKDAFALLLTPLCFSFRIPYVMPIAMGLLGSPASIIPVSGGVILYYVLQYIVSNQAQLAGGETESILPRFQGLLDGLLHHQEMIVVLAAFAVTLAVVYLIRRLSIDHAWTVAIVAGGLLCMALLLLGEMIFDLQMSVFGIVLGTLISIAIAKAVQFFALNLDYARTERVQFEDDEYYYYVKAVPKITVFPPEKTVKKINQPHKAQQGRKTGAHQSGSRGKTDGKHGVHQ